MHSRIAGVNLWIHVDKVGSNNQTYCAYETTSRLLQYFCLLHRTVWQMHAYQRFRITGLFSALG
jgi:hypothetical protein